MIGDDAIFGKQFFLEGSGRRKRQTDAVVMVRPRTVHARPTGLPPSGNGGTLTESEVRMWFIYVFI